MQTLLQPHPAQPETNNALSFEEYLHAYNSVEGIRTEWVAGKVESYRKSNNLKHQNSCSFWLTYSGFFSNAINWGKLFWRAFPCT
jgi:hypothetical protein